jgi:hypothetical protein
MKVEYKALNKIDTLQEIEKKESEYFSFSSHIKEKYHLNNDLMRVLDLISFEEILALKIEKMIDIFNGKFFLPYRDIYLLYIYKAIVMLSDAYDDSSKKRKIRSILMLSKKNKLKTYNKIFQTYLKGARYNKK